MRSRPLALLSLWCLLAADPAPAAAQEGPFWDTLKRGIVLFETRKFEESIAAFARAGQIDPGNWRPYAWEAFAHIQLALLEPDIRRRKGHLSAANAMSGALLKHAKLTLVDPLYLYIRGLIVSVDKGQPLRAYDYLRKAARSRRAERRKYDEISLRQHVKRAYARAAMDVARSLIMRGGWEKADPLLLDAFAYFRNSPPEEKGALLELHRHMAVVDEALGRYERSIHNLRVCGQLTDSVALKQEFVATIAMILFKIEKLDEGLKVLEEVPEDCQHPDVLGARCHALMRQAKRDPESEVMDRALAFYLETIEVYPEDQVYRLVEDYGELLLEKIGLEADAEERKLVEKTIVMVEREKKLRPECPRLYWLLAKFHRLLGHKSEAEELERLHARRKIENEKSPRFDQRGRPRCR